MSYPTDLDLIRALVEGRLAAGDRARLEERMASESELRELFEEYELVHGLSAPLIEAGGVYRDLWTVQSGELNGEDAGETA